MTKQSGRFGKLLLLIAIIGAAVAAVPLVPLSPLKNSVELKLSETLGRRVTVDSVRLSLLMTPHLILTGMTAHEDPAFGEDSFVKASEVRASFDVIQYLRSRRIVIDSLTLKSPQIDLVKNRAGVWSWTTLGNPITEKKASKLVSEPVSYSSILALSSSGALSYSTFREIRIESASVKLRDYSGAEPSEVLFKNIVLNASLTPETGVESERSTRASGTLVLQSEEDGGAALFKATLPFDLRIEGRDQSTLVVSGSIGPGPIETRNIGIRALTINGEMNSKRNTPLTGNGKMSVSDLDIHTVNLSERVARALNLDQIGDMSAGTGVASLETDFQISEGVVHTTGLSIQQLDGLGDATAPDGSFKIESSLIVNYAATVVLSPEATARVKQMSPALGLVVTILETNNRVSVPIDIKGDERNPQVQVDVSRIF